MNLNTLGQQIAQAQAQAEATQQELGAVARVSMGNRSRSETMHLAVPIRVVVMLLAVAVGAVFLQRYAVQKRPDLAILCLFGSLIVGFILVRVINVAAQWERGVVLRLGKMQAVRGPGLVLIFPVIDYLKVVDMRTQTVEIPQQRVITRDNVPVSINGVLYFKVVDVELAITKVQEYQFAILQYAQAALRDVIGGLTLDEMLAERDQIQKAIEKNVEKHAGEWGLEVDALRLLDIDMPEDLKKVMSRQASAEREKRATITKAEGDKLAAVNLAEAACTMLASPGAMQLRTLQTLDGLGASPSNTVVLSVPSDVYEAVARAAGKALPPKPPSDPA